MRSFLSLSWFWLIIFGLLPIIFFNGLVDSYELAKVLAFICILNVYFGSSFGIITHNYRLCKWTSFDKLLLAFGTVELLSVVVNRDFQNGIFGQYYRYQGLITLACFGGFYFVSSLITDRLKLVIVKIIQWSGVVNSIIVFIQGILYFGLKIPIYNYNGRMAGLMGNPNFMAGFLALSFVFSEFKYLPLFLAAIIFTGSRSGLIGIGAAVILKLLYQERNIGRKLLIVLAVAGLMLGVYKLGNRPSSTFDSRTIIWTHGFEAAITKPILGWGRENFSLAFESTLKMGDYDLKNIRVDKAHNEFLEVLVESGIIGLILYVIIGLKLFFQLFKERQNLWVRLNLFAYIVFLIMSSVNVVNINEYLFFYLSLGVGRQLEIKKSVCKSDHSDQPE